MAKSLIATLLLLAGCATAPRAAPLDPIALARSMTGCWEGTRPDGRRTMLRVIATTYGAEFQINGPEGATCQKGTPFLIVGKEIHGLVATSLLPDQRYVWTVTATADSVLLTPANAPVWMRLKRLDADRVEWSNAGYSDGKSYVDADILTRTEPAP